MSLRGRLRTLKGVLNFLMKLVERTALSDKIRDSILVKCGHVVNDGSAHKYVQQIEILYNNEPESLDER